MVYRFRRLDNYELGRHANQFFDLALGRVLKSLPYFGVCLSVPELLRVEGFST